MTVGAPSIRPLPLLSNGDLIEIAKGAVCVSAGLFGLDEERYPLLSGVSGEAYIEAQRVLANARLDSLDFSSCFSFTGRAPTMAAFIAEAAIILEEAVHSPCRGAKRYVQLARDETIACDLAIPIFIRKVMEECFGLERLQDAVGPPDGLYCWPEADCAKRVADRVLISWPGSDAVAPIRPIRRLQSWELDVELRGALDEVRAEIWRCSRANRTWRRTLRIAARRTLRRYRRQGTVWLLASLPVIDREWPEIAKKEGWPMAWGAVDDSPSRTTPRHRVVDADRAQVSILRVAIAFIDAVESLFLRSSIVPELVGSARRFALCRS